MCGKKIEEKSRKGKQSKLHFKTYFIAKIHSTRVETVETDTQKKKQTLKTGNTKEKRKTREIFAAKVILQFLYLQNRARFLFLFFHIFIDFCKAH